MPFIKIDGKQIEIVDDETVAWLHTKAPAQSIEMAATLHEMARELLGNEIRQGRPDWDDLAVARKVARRLLNDENVPQLHAEDLRTSGRF